MYFYRHTGIFLTLQLQKEFLSISYIPSYSLAIAAFRLFQALCAAEDVPVVHQ